MAESDYTEITIESERDLSFTNGGTETVKIIKPVTSTEPSTLPQSRPSAKLVGPVLPPRLVLPETKCSTVPATHQKSALNEEPQMRQRPKRQVPRPPTQQNLQKNPVCGQDTSELNISPTVTIPSPPAVVEVNPEPMSPKRKSPPPNPPLQSKPTRVIKPESLSQESLTPCEFGIVTCYLFSYHIHLKFVSCT